MFEFHSLIMKIIKTKQFFSWQIVSFKHVNIFSVRVTDDLMRNSDRIVGNL